MLELAPQRHVYQFRQEQLSEDTALSPYLGQGQSGLSAGAALNPELSRLDPVAGAFAVDVEAVVGRFTCWEKAERVPSQCWSKMSPDTLY